MSTGAEDYTKAECHKPVGKTGFQPVIGRLLTTYICISFDTTSSPTIKDMGNPPQPFERDTTAILNGAHLGTSES